MTGAERAPGGDGGRRVEHDPLAEEADLLTLREARARITGEIDELRRRIGEFESGPEGERAPELEAVRRRLGHLRRAAERFGA